MKERVWVGGESLGLGHDQSLIDGAQLCLGAEFFGRQECGFPFRSRMVFHNSINDVLFFQEVGRAGRKSDALNFLLVC